MLTKNILSLAVVLGLLPPLAGATQSQGTQPVVGQGAPLAPMSVTLDKPLILGRASTATAADYSDPDGDPLDHWEYEWRTAPLGAGSLLGAGASYSPGNENTVYLRSRALAARGYPDEQKEGAWAEQPLTPQAAIGARCTSGRTLSANGLTWTCPLTTSEADAAGITYQATNTELGQTWVRMNWSTANSYCQGQGYRLATKDELSALYVTKGDMSAAGWPISNHYYWASTEYNAGSHYGVALGSGGVSYVIDSGHDFVTCVR